MKKNYYLLVGFLMAAILAFITFVGPHLPFIDKDLSGERILFPSSGVIKVAPFPPSDEFILGSDREGRDMLSLLVVGAKDTFMLIFFIVILRYIIALPLGLLGAKDKGFFAWLVRGWSQLFSSLPVVIIVALILCLPPLLFHEHRFFIAILVIALVDVGRVAFIIQKQAHELSKKPFVEAGVTIGNNPIKMLYHYYLPNLLPEVVVNFFSEAARVAMLIGQLAVLSVFISQGFVQTGYGSFSVENLSHDWATLIKDARADFVTAIWIPFYPMLAIVVAALTFNILGEGFRKHFNRHMPL
ncbi:ABC transporter permease [Cytobacillus gottheilii]|uniref:ABC transporter permease n=1 Tax=Cytobacillus gottheilii TaxID=859144 RepID=UPI0009B9C961|nr:ABC transporter permease subunit [Cytobacillus gottheilii]